MSGIIDYAGLFPPAQLPLEEALSNYARYRRGGDSWMLARFIIPARQLATAASLPALASFGEPTGPAEKGASFSIIGRGGATAAEFHAGLEADLQAMADFRRQHGAYIALDAFEVKLPPALLDPPDVMAIRDLLVTAAEMLATQGSVTPFYEAPLAPVGHSLDAWKAGMAATIEAIAAYNQRVPATTNGPVAGFKLRCGGVAAVEIPALEQVSFALATCLQAVVPMKATAGLHHPVRHFDETVQAKMHGFFNFFGAGILTHIHGMNEAEARTILEDEDSDHFQFSENAFTWHSLSATLDEIDQARHQAVLSYGSCSFDEPRHDLRALGLLPKPDRFS